ncbi:MAG: flippase-like domain-containing protein [Candidatus Muirbacterium halophilum]|nr:flippase-like domain-containing protein [Candidatus Muirbacterium halophilum]MCK9475736.1 flippase-like domain-containing protein [Candidatus Muirbacterium halophilum]
MKKWTVYLRIVGFVLFFYFLKKISLDWDSIINAITQVDKYLFSLALFLSFASVFLRVFRMNIIIKKVNSENIYYSFFEKYLIYFTSLFFGSITPSRIGEVVKMRYFAKLGKFKAIFIIVWDRIWDVFYILIPGIISFYFLGLKNFFYISVFAGILLIILFLIFRKSLIKFIPEKIKVLFKKENLIFNFKDLFYMNFYTFLSFIFYFIWYYLLFLMIGVKVPIIYMFWLQCFTVLINVLPISMMGIGTRMAANLYFLGKIGISENNIVVFEFIILFFYIITIVAGFVFWNLLEHIIKRRPETYEV